MNQAEKNLLKKAGFTPKQIETSLRITGFLKKRQILKMLLQTAETDQSRIEHWLNENIDQIGTSTPIEIIFTQIVAAKIRADANRATAPTGNR